MQYHKPVGLEKEKLARVARTPICQHPQCSGLPRHLAIEILEERLDEDKATAISYTWGEFDRQKIRIGHVKDNPDQDICIELGKEWMLKPEEDLLGLQKRLASLSSEKPIWLDQLCIPQKDEAVREALAEIPTIYSTFEVVILMPGNVCKCLGGFLEEIKVPNDLGENFSPTVDRKFIFEVKEKYQDCLNFTSSSTWFGRLWTRQELMYSRRIRCVWASDDLSQCVKPPYEDQHIEHLGPHSALAHEEYMRRGFPSYHAFTKLVIEQRRLAHYAFIELFPYLRETNQWQRSDPRMSTAYHQLLGGKVLEKDPRTSGGSLDKFLHVLVYITRSLLFHHRTRKATHDRDYVLSVWVDCPGYILPDACVLKDPAITMGYLMQDAMDQLAQNHKISILTTAPRGLFESTSSSSAMWHPQKYFKSITTISDLRDVYGPIVQNSLSISLGFGDKTTGNVFISIHCDYDAPQSLTKMAKDFDAFFRDQQDETAASRESLELATSRMIEDLGQIVSEWSQESCNLIHSQFFLTVPDLMVEWSSGYPEGIPLDSELSKEKVHPWALVARLFDPLLGDMVVSHIYRRPKGYLYHMQWNVECIKDTVEKIMAVALGLNVEVCRKNNVRIMLSNTEEVGAKRLGFYRGGDKRLSQISGAEDAYLVRSVAMSLGHRESSHDDQQSGSGGVTDPGCLIYEAARETDNPGEYTVFGVWVPIHGRKKMHNAERWWPQHGLPEVSGRRWGVLV
jgi:hypothetical protein